MKPMTTDITRVRHSDPMVPNPTGKGNTLLFGGKLTKNGKYTWISGIALRNRKKIFQYQYYL